MINILSNVHTHIKIALDLVVTDILFWCIDPGHVSFHKNFGILILNGQHLRFHNWQFKSGIIIFILVGIPRRLVVVIVNFVINL